MLQLVNIGKNNLPIDILELLILNENYLKPGVYYKNHDQDFDISKFVPYVPKKSGQDS